MKRYFNSKKQALNDRDSKNEKAGFRKVMVFKMKYGRNKGKFFVGSELEFLNLN